MSIANTIVPSFLHMIETETGKSWCLSKRRRLKSVSSELHPFSNSIFLVYDLGSDETSISMKIFDLSVSPRCCQSPEVSSARERIREIARGPLQRRVPPLCLQTRGLSLFCPSSPRLTTCLRTPFGLSSRPSFYFPTLLSASRCSPHALASSASEKRPRSLSCRFSPPSPTTGATVEI